MPVARRLSEARRLADARLIAATSTAAAPSCGANGSPKAPTGLIALSGFAARRRRRRRCCRAIRSRRRARRAAHGRSAFPDRYYLEVQRAGHADDDALTAATVRLAGELDAARRRHASGAVRDAATSFARTRRASASPRATCSPTRDGRSASRPSSISRRRTRWRRRFADLPQALANSVAIAQRCNLTLPLGKNYLPQFPDAGRRDARAAPAQRGERGARAPPRRCSMPMPPSASAGGPSTSRDSSSRSRRSCRWAIAGYFLIVADFINWAKKQRRARSDPGADRARDRWSRTASASPISTRCATRCCSSAFSIRSACRCPTSTSTSARTAAIASSTTSSRSTAPNRCRRSRPSAPWRPRPWCATSAACSTCPTASATASPS